MGVVWGTGMGIGALGKIRNWNIYIQYNLNWNLF